MDDTAESIAKQKEIDELLSGQLTQEDEDEVLKELEHLEELEELNKLVTEEENVEDKLPEVPMHELPGTTSLIEPGQSKLQCKNEQKGYKLIFVTSFSSKRLAYLHKSIQKP